MRRNRSCGPGERSDPRNSGEKQTAVSLGWHPPPDVAALIRAAAAQVDARAQLLVLTRKITGKVKVRPSSAITGGGIGTGSERRTIASAASSKAASPEPFSISVEST